MTKMSSTVYYDHHTLFIRCDCATEEQIRHGFLEAIRQYKEKYDKSLDCRIKVNRVENRNGISYGTNLRA